MKKKYIVLMFCLSLISIHAAFSQTRDARLKTRGYVNPQEIVSLDSTMRMDQALLVINELSKQFAGKIIIDLEKRRSQIGVYIVNQHWRDALEIILTRHGLTFIEEADYIRIVQAGTGGPISETGQPAQIPGEPPPTLEARDVKISAVFFSTDVTKMQDYGISWNFFRNKKNEPNTNLYISAGIGSTDTLGNIPPAPRGSFDKALGVFSSPPEFTFANIDALVKFFGSNSLGEILTSPDVIVRNGRKGRIQVGTDIFVATRDIAGNTINQQISTGTIIEVTPMIYSQADTDFIYLDILIEQSEASEGPKISRNVVKTHALLYDGEETVIGGLVHTLDIQTREGIPILKDLPWWFLGLRYIFGSDSKQKIKNELVILLKVELSKPIRDRMLERRTRQELINNKRDDYKKEFDKKE
jgi:type IV pilus assembly protein PilQ